MNVIERQTRRNRLAYGLVGLGISLFGIVIFSLKHIATRALPPKATGNENDGIAAAPYQNRREWPQDSNPGLLQQSKSVTAVQPGESGPINSHLGISDPRVEVAKVMARLERSGPATGDLAARAANVFDVWKHDSSVGGKVEFGDFRCYADGCSTIARYTDMNAYFEMVRDFQMSKAFLMWTRPKFGSGPIQDSSGNVQATWVLFH